MLLESAVAVGCCLANVVRNAEPWKNFKLNRNAGRRQLRQPRPGRWRPGQLSCFWRWWVRRAGAGRTGAGRLESGLAPPPLLLGWESKKLLTAELWTAVITRLLTGLPSAAISRPHVLTLDSGQHFNITKKGYNVAPPWPPWPWPVWGPLPTPWRPPRPCCRPALHTPPGGSPPPRRGQAG